MVALGRDQFLWWISGFKFLHVYIFLETGKYCKIRLIDPHNIC